MNIEEAIKIAIDYETKVRDLYVSSMNDTKDEQGKKIFQTLAKEEQGHLDYLNDRMKHWKETGKLDAPKLGTVVPPKKLIDEGMAVLKKDMNQECKETELELMKKALDAETTTSNFYKKMVDELPGEGKEMFRRFMEIEEGHQAIVQAEIDALSGHGAWFDFTEIRFEMG